MNILYHDNSMIVAYKPYGILSESDGRLPNMPALLKEETGCEVFPVHRLDRTTQGLMVYAKTPEAAKRMSAAVQNGGMEKVYLAVVPGEPEQPSGELADLLYFDRRKNKSYVVGRERRGVKKACLRYELVQTAHSEGQKLSLLRIVLLTGRTHQIRVQFASRQMPLVGDRRYGSRIVSRNIMLCASRLSFMHPFSGKALSFSFLPKNDYFALFDTASV